MSVGSVRFFTRPLAIAVVAFSLPNVIVQLCRWKKYTHVRESLSTRARVFPIQKSFSQRRSTYCEKHRSVRAEAHSTLTNTSGLETRTRSAHRKETFHFLIGLVSLYPRQLNALHDPLARTTAKCFCLAEKKGGGCNQLTGRVDWKLCTLVLKFVNE